MSALVAAILFSFSVLLEARAQPVDWNALPAIGTGSCVTQQAPTCPAAASLDKAVRPVVGSVGRLLARRRGLQGPSDPVGLALSLKTASEVTEDPFSVLSPGIPCLKGIGPEDGNVWVDLQGDIPNCSSAISLTASIDCETIPLGAGATKTVQKGCLPESPSSRFLGKPVYSAFYEITRPSSSGARAAGVDSHQQGKNYLRQLNEISTIHSLQNAGVSGIPRLLGIHVQQDAVTPHFELAMGGSLAQYSAASSDPKKYLSPSNIVQVAHNTCNTLVDMHSKGFVHKDVKPANILVKSINRNKIETVLGDLDQAMHSEWIKRPEELETRGIDLHATTAEYQGPHFMRASEFAHFVKQDQFAFGLTVVELITGRKPSWIKEARGGEWKTQGIEKDAVSEYINAAPFLETDPLRRLLECSLDVLTPGPCPDFSALCKEIRPIILPRRTDNGIRPRRIRPGTVHPAGASPPEHGPLPSLAPGGRRGNPGS